MPSLDKIRNFSIRRQAAKLEAWYEKYEHKLMPLAMMLGVTVDFIAFRRIDLFFENLVLLVYLVLGATGITIVNLYEGQRIGGRFLDRARLWLPLLIQFSFGGLFSAFVVFYVKSASFATSWPFLLVLIAIMVGNEFARKRYIKLTLHMSIYFLALFSFAIFYLPIVFKSISAFVFILSGLISLLLISLFILVIARAIPGRVRQARQALIASIASIYFAVNFLYVSNIIPPIPLALKEIGVFHEVTRSGHEYHAWAEARPWYEWFLLYERISVVPGAPVYIFSAVFAPTELTTPVIHHWQYQDNSQQEWLTKDKLSYQIIGGRDGGYRGYSLKNHTLPGFWRVDIETESGQVIGRVRFKIEATNQTPELAEKIF